MFTTIKPLQLQNTLNNSTDKGEDTKKNIWMRASVHFKGNVDSKEKYEEGRWKDLLMNNGQTKSRAHQIILALNLT